MSGNDERIGRHARVYREEDRWYFEVLATRGNLPDEAVGSSPAPGYADPGGAVEALRREHPGVDWTVEDQGES